MTVDLITARALNTRITKNVYGGKGGPIGDITELLMSHKALIEEVEYLRTLRPANIPAVRRQFQDINAEIRAAWQTNTVEEYQAAWPPINEKRVALCMKYFGHDLYVDGEYLDGEMVLDWIEYFIEVAQ